jgi:hypothetical protein
VRAGTFLATGSCPSNRIVATGRPRPRPPPIRKRSPTCELIQRNPAAQAKRWTIRSGSSTSWRVVFNPKANRTMPATIGRCRYEYAFLASAARDAPVASANAAWATKDDPVEIRPPETSRRRRSQGVRPRSRRRRAGGPRRRPDRHARLAGRDDDDQPEGSTKRRCRGGPPRTRSHLWMDPDCEDVVGKTRDARAQRTELGASWWALEDLNVQDGDGRAEAGEEDPSTVGRPIERRVGLAPPGRTPSSADLHDPRDRRSMYAMEASRRLPTHGHRDNARGRRPPGYAWIVVVGGTASRPASFGDGALPRGAW